MALKNKCTVLFLILAVSTISCDRFSTNKEDDNANALEEEAASESQITDKAILLTNVDQLRLRRYNDTKSEMLTTFDENTPLYYLDEQTDYSEKIGSHKGPWLKVATLDGSETGWVFGAEHFVSWMINRPTLDSLHQVGKDIRLFDNLNKGEMAKLTGANWSGNILGTRYSGYYEYDKEGDPQLINGRVHIRARVFDTETRKVQYIPCSLEIENGMPKTSVTCLEDDMER